MLVVEGGLEMPCNDQCSVAMLLKQSGGMFRRYFKFRFTVTFCRGNAYDTVFPCGSLLFTHHLSTFAFLSPLRRCHHLDSTVYTLHWVCACRDNLSATFQHHFSSLEHRSAFQFLVCSPHAVSYCRQSIDRHSSALRAKASTTHNRL